MNRKPPYLDQVPVKNALISVFDKSGLEPLCQALKEYGVQVYSTGGTAKAIEAMGLPVRKIEDVTQFPEMMDGRVKTLHPRVFGGILARRSVTQDMDEAKRFEIPLFDLVVVNLYPFWDHRGESIESQTKFIDIGGPSMVRAAAKNSEVVTILSSPDDYTSFVEEIHREKGATTWAFRHGVAAKAFGRTAAYDSMIAEEWRKEAELPAALSLSPQTTLRYGENPHQKAAWAGEAKWKVLQGKELSYNNLLDAEAAWKLALEFPEPSVAIIKHNNPCGVASGEGTIEEVFLRALSTDSKSAFGGIVATNREVDGKAAQAMSQLFLEVVLAKHFAPEAVEVFSAKKNLRLIEWAEPKFQPFEVRSALGGWLVQQADTAGVPESLKTVTETSIDDSLWADLKFAWRVCKHVRSNAIVLARRGTTLGIGAGQMSRVDAVQIALQKAAAVSSGSLEGAVLASDAFFPFRDNIDLLKGLGIRAIIQPGGSQRDQEVIQACNEHKIAMAFTGIRHFRH